MGKFLKFEKMLTPIFIQLFFWIGFLGSVITGLIMLFTGIFSGAFVQIMMGFSCLLFGPVFIRIYCEMLIVVFKIQGSLIDIRDLLDEDQDLEGEHDEAI